MTLLGYQGCLGVPGYLEYQEDQGLQQSAQPLHGIVNFAGVRRCH